MKRTTMATLFEILEGSSYNSMLTKDISLGAEKTSIILAKSKNIISDNKRQGRNAYIF